MDEPTFKNVEIHEFSTGIRPERTADGGWVSRGFTGQYMNATIDPIPLAVERSIANKLFAVAEGASSDRPAVIGRVVLGNEDNEEPDWSVVAIITRGKDEHGRSASFYRYFLCEGDDSLPKILQWIEDYRKSKGQIPVFNPFHKADKKNLNITSTPVSSREDSLTDIIFKPCTYKESQLQVIHDIANEKANNHSVAWAFNVEALEQPRTFHIIQAASDKAYDLLQKYLVITPELPMSLLTDEQAIKSAIRGLINSSKVKSEHVETIAESVGNSQIELSYWEEVFNGQGSKSALTQGIYSPQMVRLLMLRSIVIPKTLPEYLNWLKKGNKQNDPYIVFTEFEYQIRKSLTPSTELNIAANIIEGIKVLLLSLLNKQVSTEDINRLLASNNEIGIWRKSFHSFIDDIDHDLKLMYQLAHKEQNLPFKLSDKSWVKIWQELQIFWRKSDAPYLEQYQPFAKVFSNFSNPKIAAFFYHVGNGEVPKEIFDQIEPHGWRTKVYELVVKREVTVPELLWLTLITLGGKIVPVAIVIPMVLLSLILGFGLRGCNLGKSDRLENTVNLRNQSNSSDITQTVSTPMNIKKDFNYTREAIKSIVEDLKSKGKTPEEIHKTILQVLQNQKLSFEVINNDSTKLSEDWTKAINDHMGNKHNGSANSNDDDTKISLLKCEVSQSLKIEKKQSCELPKK